VSDLGTVINQAVRVLKEGGLLVYPTEAVYGLGGDYRQAGTVNRILQLKNRSAAQGLILVAGHIQYLLPLIKPATGMDLAMALKTWPGHHTWVFPASNLVPDNVKGPNNTVAVRLSDHPVIKYLTDALGGALISTSANIHGQKTRQEIEAIKQLWGQQVDYFLDLPLGKQTQPSAIHLAGDGRIIR